MPTTAESPPFLAALPAAFAESRPPVVYQVLRGVEPGGGTPYRYARSAPYRAEGYACHPFHRPLTKLLPAG
jgi:hypothetical protein